MTFPKWIPLAALAIIVLGTVLFETRRCYGEGRCLNYSGVAAFVAAAAGCVVVAVPGGFGRRR